MDQNQTMTVDDRLEGLANVLDKLGDIPGGGRGKCGLVWVANDLLNGLSQDIAMMQEEIARLKKEKENDERTEDEDDSQEDN